MRVKGLYRLRKLSDGKQFANNINESRLKPFHERKTEYSNGSSQNLGEKQVVGSRDENIILNEKSIAFFDDEHAHSKQVRQDANLLDTTNSVLKTNCIPPTCCVYGEQVLLISPTLLMKMILM